MKSISEFSNSMISKNINRKCNTLKINEFSEKIIAKSFILPYKQQKKIFKWKSLLTFDVGVYLKNITHL